MIPGWPQVVAAAAAFEPNAWLTITPDGAVTVHITKAEMGQGIGTALAQIVAEELEADWKDVRIDYPVNDPKYGGMLTGGSTSIATSFGVLARAGAAARIMLIDAAATLWTIDAADCVAERGGVRHPPTGRSISYGGLVAKVPITKTLSADELTAIQLKKPGQYTLVGKSIPRLDIPEKIDGRAKYGSDVFLPGMAYAKVAYPPTREAGKHGAVDDSAARRIPGYVKTVVTDDLVAVVAETYEAAVAARDALRIVWERGPHASVSSESILRDYEQTVQREPGVVWARMGDAAAAMAGAATTRRATYVTDFAVQAQMEPLNCVARYVDGTCDLYTATQWQERVVAVLTKSLGVEASKIRIHQHYLGGGFGRKLDVDIELEAALIAREAGRPVKLIRSREEDLQRGYYRPLTLQVLTAGRDAGGRTVAWEHVLISPSTTARIGNFGRNTIDASGRDSRALRGADHYYEIPNQLQRWIRRETGIPSGLYRAVEPGYGGFAIESFLDELAHLDKTDPLQFRLAMLGSRPRLTNVLKLVAARSGWGTALPVDVGRGLAVAAGFRSTQTWMAAAVQARVDRASGEVHVQKITCAVDCGLVVNPDGVRAQVEGSILQTVSRVLMEEVMFDRARVTSVHWVSYPILRFSDAPKIEIELIDRPTMPPLGAGEAACAAVGAALGNAVYDATGARLRTVPFTPERVKAAMGGRA